jgi:hypothetical protein
VRRTCFFATKPRRRSASCGSSGRMWAAHPRGCLRQRRRLTQLWPGVVVQRRRVHEEHTDPEAPQLKGHGVPVFDQERDPEQRQWVTLTRRRGNRIKRSQPEHARDPLLAISPEVAQATSRPLQIARSLAHPVIRIPRLHPRVELAEVAAGACVLQPRRAQRRSPWRGSDGTYQAA